MFYKRSLLSLEQVGSRSDVTCDGLTFEHRRRTGDYLSADNLDSCSCFFPPDKKSEKKKWNLSRACGGGGPLHALITLLLNGLSNAGARPRHRLVRAVLTVGGTDST